MKKIAASILFVPLAFLVGCNETLPKGQGSAVLGGLIGGVAGGVAGHQVDDKKGRYVGAIAGAVIGYQLAQMLSQRDQESLAKSTQETASTGEKRTWSNPETGVKGETRVVSAPAAASSTAAAPTASAPAAAVTQESPENYRLIEQRVELPDGTVKTETIKLRKGADGTWQAV
jgi:surface antigen